MWQTQNLHFIFGWEFSETMKDNITATLGQYHHFLCPQIPTTTTAATTNSHIVLPSVCSPSWEIQAQALPKAKEPLSLLTSTIPVLYNTMQATISCWWLMHEIQHLEKVIHLIRTITFYSTGKDWQEIRSHTQELKFRKSLTTCKQVRKNQ